MKLEVTAVAVVVASAAAGAYAQSYQKHNLTPDGYWHNRYHALLSMSTYGDYNTLCPNQTFNQATLTKNFPNSTRAPWTLINTFGPTASGARGFTAVVPEMNKALIVFGGDYELEQTLPTDVVSWAYLGLNSTCGNCTVNRFAAQGYMEAKNETNGWKAILGAYAGQGLVFSITGHGLGGMHSQIASADLNHQQVAYYSHAYGAPRVFNQAGATWYNNRFNGEAGERGVANNDQYTEFIPEGVNYTHAGTQFHYTGLNATSNAPNMEICWTEDGDYGKCGPTNQNNGTTAIEDHYFYFGNVGQCGGTNIQNKTVADQYIRNSTVAFAAASSASVSSRAAASSAGIGSASAAIAAAATGAPAATTAKTTSATGSASSPLALGLSGASLVAMSLFSMLL